MLSNSSIIAQPLKPIADSMASHCGNSSTNGQREDVVVGNSKGYIGVLEVFIHKARDIHNICIYHKQDVYARICLTSDPETTVSTQTINGGGQNPVFNQKLQINVRTLDSSLKCEIWMLSRVRNYLEDQLLGFALVPLSDVLLQNGKLAKEFQMSSSDLFHSPSGFVELTLAYTGASPEVLEIPKPSSSLASNRASEDLEMCNSVPSELDKIEFPDPIVASENEMMVTEYYANPCSEVGSQTLQLFGNSEEGNQHSSDESNQLSSEESNQISSEESTQLSSDVSVDMPERFTEETSKAFVVKQVEFPPSSDSVKDHKDNGKEASNVTNTFAQNGININLEAEQNVVQQDIVDMYMKSMKQFTEALAKMKLPLDVENGSPDSVNTGNDGKLQASKGEGPSPKVFYGSRAFF